VARTAMIILDTHIWVWWVHGDERLTETQAQVVHMNPREMIEASIKRKLLEVFGDRDEGLEIRESVRATLLRQKAVAEGERGELLGHVVGRLGLE